jgi:hypothetical protein
MNNEKLIIPKGKGFEIDYDYYNTKKTRRYENADEWWKYFCLNGSDELEQSGLKADLIKELDGDTYLAMAVNHFIGKNYKAWLDNKGIEDLGGLTPRQCLGSDYRMKRLRMLFLTSH